METQSISTGTSGPEPEAGEEWLGDAEGEVRSLLVPAEMHGWRLDRALVALVQGFSRSWLQQLVADGAVTLRGRACTKSATKVSAGDACAVELRPTPQAMAFVPEPMALAVVHEDEHLLVIDKPAGLVVHPAAGHWSGTMLNGLLAHHAAAAQLPRAGIVHRLDKDTSGLMLVAKSRAAMDALVRAIAAREVNRQYLALGQGAWRGEAQREVDLAIGRDPQNRLRMAGLRTGGKPAQSTLRLLDGNDQACLVACKLHTGRTHQIRVHMASLGHPLVGDAVYGGRRLWGMQRQALHAAHLRLLHPVGGQPLSFWREPPADFSEALKTGGLHYNPPIPGDGLIG